MGREWGEGIDFNLSGRGIPSWDQSRFGSSEGSVKFRTMGDIGRGLSSQLSTAPYLTGGHYARSPGTGGKFTAPLPLAIGAMSWALNTLQPSLGATATTSAEKLSVVKAEVAFAFLLFLWGAYWNYRGHVRRLSRRAYAESAYPWTGNGKPEDFPQRDWTTASEPPYGWSLLELASSAGSALASVPRFLSAGSFDHNLFELSSSFSSPDIKIHSSTALSLLVQKIKY